MTPESRKDWLKTLLLVGLFVVALNWQTLFESMRGRPDYNAALAGPVTIYGTQWCGYCKKTRHFLKTHDIPFVDLDIEASAPARRQFERLGGRGVPVVTIGDQVIHGYNLRGIRKALECADCKAANAP